MQNPGVAARSGQQQQAQQQAQQFVKFTCGDGSKMNFSTAEELLQLGVKEVYDAEEVKRLKKQLAQVMQV